MLCSKYFIYVAHFLLVYLCNKGPLGTAKVNATP